MFLIRKATASTGLVKLSCWVVMLVVGYVVSAGVTQALSVRKPIRVLTTKDGLPQSFVSGMVQDSAGFVWIGTRSGLARYDGRQFVTFHYQQGDSTTLSSDVLISLVPDRRKHIWIEYESGEIDRFLPRSQQVERISHRPLFRRNPRRFARRGWTIDTRGNLWGTQLIDGVWCYNWHKQQIYHFTRQSHGLPNDTIRGLLSSRRGNGIWLLSRNELSRLNPATGKVQSVRLPVSIEVAHLPGLAGGTVRLHERNNGEIMWAFHNQLLVFNPRTNRFRQLPLSAASENYLCWFYTGPDGQDYFTVFNQLYRYDGVRGAILMGEMERSSQGAESLLVDQSGLIWMGTNAAGIHLIDPSGPHFDVHPNQLGFHPDLFRQTFGLSLDQIFNWPATDGGFRQLSYYLRSTFDHRNRLWVGLRYRAGYYDPVQRRLVLLPPIPTAKPTSDLLLGISGLHFDPTGKLWTVDNDGHIACFDTLQRTWTNWLSADQLLRVIDPQIVPQDIVADGKAIWITSHRHGLIRIERASKQIRVINQATPLAHLPSNLLLGMQPDPANPNLLWIGSHAGLIVINKTTLRGRTFTTANGLPDNTIYSILADRRGFLWLSTNRGLCRFDPRTHQVRRFNTTDGLPGDEFNRFHHLRLPDGQFAFGGTDGWVLFDPLAAQNDRFEPSVALIELKINNQIVPVTPGRPPLPGPINELTELEVPFRSNTLSLSFAGLEYNQPGRLRYRYRLDGYDKNWVDADLVPLASYTQLPPGQYNLQVSATNTTGHWSPHVHKLAITVTPPWWRSWLAYGFYALLGFSLLRVYIRLRTQQERERQQRLVQQHDADRLRELNELKSRFFTNITHELRTPLTLILGPTERLRAVVAEPEWQRWLTVIDRNAQQLLNLINQLLDLSRLEAGVVSVDERRGDVRLPVSQFVDAIRPEAEAKGLELVFVDQLGPGQYWFDADKLERIGLNLLANAVKFTRQGRITVTLQTGVRLLVEDTGPGMTADELVHIFDRFYQGRVSSATAPGSGIGLALVKELVDLQGGTISVESQPEELGKTATADRQSGGTRFTVELPYRLAGPPVPAAAPVSDEGTALEPLVEVVIADQEKPLVLVVEDNAELGDFIAESLPTHYRILRAGDGLQGLEAALAEGPDLVISDVLMPRMDGYTLCQTLKQDRRTSHIPVILLTAKVTLDDRMKGLTGGADDYLAKPFHVGELQLRVRNLLERQLRQRDWLRAQMTSQPATAEPPAVAPVQSGAGSPVAADPFLVELGALLDRRLNEAQFGVEELALALGISRVHLYRKVKALSGLTATEFLRNYRLQQATRLLRTGCSVGDASSRVGFESPAYFAKCFRDLYGLTPTDFQAQLKNNTPPSSGNDPDGLFAGNR